MSTNDYSYYNGYLLDDIYSWELTVEDKELLNACVWLVDNAHSIRTTATNFCIPKSTLHSNIHSKLPKLSYELYNCVKRQLKVNKDKHSNKRL